MTKPKQMKQLKDLDDVELLDKYEQYAPSSKWWSWFVEVAELLMYYYLWVLGFYVVFWIIIFFRILWMVYPHFKGRTVKVYDREIKRRNLWKKDGSTNKFVSFSGD